MADETNTANTQQTQQPAAAGAPPPQGLKRDPSLDDNEPQELRGPRSWDEMKAWIRREMELHGQGLTHEERDAANP